MDGTLFVYMDCGETRPFLDAISGKRQTLSDWTEASRMTWEAWRKGLMIMVPPAGKKNIAAAEELYDVLKRFRNFQFPRHESGPREPNYAAEVKPGDRVLIIRPLCDNREFALVRAAVMRGECPKSAPGVKQKPHVVFSNRFGRKVRMEVKFGFEVVDAS